jgi:hypothetical protein
MSYAVWASDHELLTRQEALQAEATHSQGKLTTTIDGTSTRGIHEQEPEHQA